MAASIQVKAVNWRHEALADIMLTEPELKLYEIAQRLGISLAWLSIVKNSDVFKDYWTIRRQAHADGLTAGIKEKAAAITELSLDIMLEDLTEQITSGKVLPAVARENVELLTKRFGFDGMQTPQAGPTTQVNLNFGLVSTEALAAARDRMRALPSATTVPAIEVKKEPSSNE